jgi:hypothetical protein
MRPWPERGTTPAFALKFKESHKKYQPELVISRPEIRTSDFPNTSVTATSMILDVVHYRVGLGTLLVVVASTILVPSHAGLMTPVVRLYTRMHVAT